MFIESSISLHRRIQIEFKHHMTQISYVAAGAIPRDEAVGGVNRRGARAGVRPRRRGTSARVSSAFSLFFTIFSPNRL
jgi:hypothetical protein